MFIDSIILSTKKVYTFCFQCCVVADESFRDRARFKSSLENEICSENDDVPKVGKILCKNDECGQVYSKIVFIFGVLEVEQRCFSCKRE